MDASKHLSLSGIATALLSPQPSVERLSDSGLVFMKLDPPLTRVANPAPLADQCSIAQQAGLDREYIVAIHFATWIAPVEPQILDQTMRLEGKAIVKALLRGHNR